MAYLKGGSYVDGDLYVDGNIRVQGYSVIGGNSAVTLRNGVASVRKDALLKFSTSSTDVKAGNVEFSQIFVEEVVDDTDSKLNKLILHFGTPPEDDGSWGTSAEDVTEDIKGVYINHPVNYLYVGIENRHPSESGKTKVALVLDQASETWSYASITSPTP